MTRRRPLARPLRVLAAGLLAVSLVAACGSDDPAATGTPVAAPTQEPPPPPPPPPPVDALLGTTPAPSAPLVALKIDDAPLARPFHQGLDAASVVYVELVEGGATRLLALYSQPPDVEVGPIRSLRESDVELLVQYGRPAVGFSGANGGVLRTFRENVAAGQLVEVSYENRPDLYRIGERRKDAKNFYASPARLAAAGAGSGAAPLAQGGATFDVVPRADATPAGTARVVFSDRESVEVRYDPATGRYAVLRAGRPLNGAAPANVLVQQVPVRASGYRDATGAVTPYTVTVGSGPLQVLRSGTVLGGQWQRPDPASPTRYLDVAGAPIPLAPGPTWVLLQPAGLPVTTG